MEEIVPNDRLNKEYSSVDSTDDDFVLVKESTDEFNQKYCTIKGCKLVTEADLEMISLSTELRQAFIKRNQIWDPLYDLPKQMESVSSQFNRTIPYLGVLLDAGHHFYPIEWIQNLLRLMHALGYNLLHLRLTDDQAFNVRLTSMPELFNPALDSGGRVYEAAELKELVAYASLLNITILPEINIPGNAGGWAGNHTPDLMVPCAKHICSEGRGLLLNTSHPKLHYMIRTVLVEMLDIFFTTPFLHLGAARMPRNTSPCLNEAILNGYSDMDDSAFESFLESLTGLHLKKVKLLRWKRVDYFDYATNMESLENDEFNRFFQNGIISNQWDTPGCNIKNNMSGTHCSRSLYLSVNVETESVELLESIRDILSTLTASSSESVSLIVGASKLGSHQWFDRNIVGRLINVAISASELDLKPMEIKPFFYKICNNFLKLDNNFCATQGSPILPPLLFSAESDFLTWRFRERLCYRLTNQLSSQIISFTWEKDHIFESAMEYFWLRFADGRLKFSPTIPQAQHCNETLQDIRSLLKQKHESKVEFTGISLDLVQIKASDESIARILSILDLMHLLNLNALQLRIVSNFGFAIVMPNHQDLLWGHGGMFAANDVERIVTHAHSLGIVVIPEITTATRAGGWFQAGVLVKCPKVLCQDGIGIGANASDSHFLAVIVSVVLELFEQFGNPPLIHLGFDEREEVMACYAEAQQLEMDLNEFERRLSVAFQFQEIDESKLLRWENAEGVVYPERTGRITHYRLSQPMTNVSGEPFFISSGLQLGNPNMVDSDAWSIYKETEKLISLQPLGIVAVVDLVDEEFWIDFGISQRLIAYSLGLSNPGLTKVDFDKHMAYTLALLGVKENLDGKVLKFETMRLKHKQLMEDRINRTCLERTSTKYWHVPKEGWLVTKL